MVCFCLTTFDMYFGVTCVTCLTTNYLPSNNLCKAKLTYQDLCQVGAKKFTH